MLHGDCIDRVPCLGGFIVASDHYCGIAGTSQSNFEADPEAVAIRAYHALNVDGIILLRLPPGIDGHYTYRGITLDEFQAYKEQFQSPDDVRKWVLRLPSPMARLHAFDIDKWKDNFVTYFQKMQAKLGDIIWVPSQWDVVHPTFEWYNFFGYDNYMLFLADYPEVADKLFAADVEVKRCISRAIVNLYKKLGAIPLIHIGTDICGKNGPVVSPAFLRQHYFPHVRKSIEPIIEADFTTVWHADGYIMPLVDDILSCGVSGFQGFQWEYGVQLEELVKKRALNGQILTIFAGPSTSSTLPFKTIKDVRCEIEYIMNTGIGQCKLFFLPANDVLPDTPVASLIDAYRYAGVYSSQILKKM